jgi:hypothetical protein
MIGSSCWPHLIAKQIPNKAHFALEILVSGQERRATWTLVHERWRDEPRGQKIRAKKMAAPRSGQVQGGNAQEGRRPRDRNRDTALQQYAEAGTCLQDESFQIQRKRSQKHWKKSTSVPLFVANAAFLIICAPQ